LPTAIKIENLSKQYRLGVYGAKTLREDLQRLWAKIRGKDDPLQKVGEVNALDNYGDGYVWALRNINLTVEQGEVLGIIGKNGAGKSTLLKILSRITSPTEGTVKIRGRIGSLLEVGTGFHPELTGRENIYLNGAILGMRREEIRRKFDDIVDFAGVAKYIDTPVKRYSSGMYVRLGFAVAAFLEPDILVVDEVLAVGDAEFQRRAIGKMQDVSRSEGRTVLFVSHNMGSIKQLCQRAILLDKGRIIHDGTSEETIERYLSNTNIETISIVAWTEKEAPGDEKLKFLKIKVRDINGEIKHTFRQNENFYIDITYKLYQNFSGYRINVWFKTIQGEIAFVSSAHYLVKNITKAGVYTLTVEIPKDLLNSGRYIIAINAAVPGVYWIVKPMEVLYVDIIGMGSHGSTFSEKWPGVVAPKLKWTVEYEIMD